MKSVSAKTLYRLYRKNRSASDENILIINTLGIDNFLLLSNSKTMGLMILKGAFRLNKFSMIKAGKKMEEFNKDKFIIFFRRLSKRDTLGLKTLREAFKLYPADFMKAINLIDKFKLKKFINLFKKLSNNQLIGSATLKEIFKINPLFLVKVFFIIDKLTIKRFNANVNNYKSIFGRRLISKISSHNPVSLMELFLKNNIVNKKGKLKILPSGTRTRSTLNTLLTEYDLKLKFVVLGMMEIRAAITLIEYLCIDKKNIIICEYAGPLNVKKQFKGYSIAPLRRGFKYENQNIFINIFEGNKTEFSKYVSRKSENISFEDIFNKNNKVVACIRLPCFPFKFIVNKCYTLEERMKFKRQMDIKKRRVIVAGSPSARELDIILRSYRKLFYTMPVDQRPILIIGLRYNFDDLLGNHYKMKYDFNKWDMKIKYRRDVVKPLEDISETDILMVDTLGELLKFYSIADLAIIGEDRNVMEPASQGVPVLFFDGKWVYNKKAKDILLENGGARCVNLLSGDLDEIFKKPGMLQKMRQATRKTCRIMKSHYLLDAVEIANFYITMAVLERI